MTSEPFVHEIWVRWSDCDPARIAYTGRLPAMALEAIEAWWKSRFGLDWYEMVVDRDLGLPLIHMSTDFRAPVTPRHKLLCEVRLLAIGRSSARFGVRGLQNGVVCFEGEFVESAVAAAAHRKIDLPADMRARLEPLVATAGPAPGG